MKALSIIAVIAVAAGSTSTAVAQQKTAPARPKSETGETCASTDGKVECRKIVGPVGARFDSAMMKRAVLGLELSPTGTARDTLGVFVTRVTPKGPAENAGIIEGDRIAAINGVDLRVAAGDVEDSYASSLPSHRLQREVQKLTPGSRVNLRVYSGGRVRDVQVTAGRASDFMRNRSLMGFGEGPGGFIWGEGPPGGVVWRDGMEMPLMQLRDFPRDFPQLDNMKIREMMPEMRKLETSPELRKMRDSMPRMREEMKMAPQLQKLREAIPPMRIQPMPMVMPFRRTIRI